MRRSGGRVEEDKSQSLLRGGPMSPIVVVVYWCLIGTSYADFNPHQLDSVKKFIHAHPVQCHTEQVEVLDVPGLSVATCKAQMIVRYMPGWKQKNNDKDYVGGDCIIYYNPVPELDLRALKDRFK
jgi:hypothetical protein